MYPHCFPLLSMARNTSSQLRWHHWVMTYSCMLRLHKQAWLLIWMVCDSIKGTLITFLNGFVIRLREHWLLIWMVCDWIKGTYWLLIWMVCDPIKEGSGNHKSPHGYLVQLVNKQMMFGTLYICLASQLNFYCLYTHLLFLFDGPEYYNDVTEWHVATWLLVWIGSQVQNT